MRDGDLAEVHEVHQGGQVLEPHVVGHDQHLTDKEKDVRTGFKGSFYELLSPGEGSLTFGALPGSKESMPTASPADA